MTAQAVEGTRSFEDMAAEHLAAIEHAYGDAMAHIAGIAEAPAVAEDVAQSSDDSATEISVRAA